MISARIIADSINPDGDRLITAECTFNRYLLSELNTHRRFSRNSASSRAIPVKKVMSQVWKNPALPLHWGINKAGMQARAELRGVRRWFARRLYLLARIPVLIIVWMMTKIKLHKQVANRLLEPWVWHTAIISSTEWDNFFKLRLHPDAQPEFQYLADRLKFAIDMSAPKQLQWGEWHLPYTDSDDVDDFVGMKHPSIPLKAFSSMARCARVSYVRQGETRSLADDLKQAESLTSSGHWSPAEHPAMAQKHSKDSNFDGFRQLRKFFPGEDGKNVAK